MKSRADILDEWLTNLENYNLEFKEARNSFDKNNTLPDYCAALANEGGGRLLLGVSDKREVVGSKAFLGTWNTLAHDLWQIHGIRINVEEINHPRGRVLAFTIPSRPIGQRVASTGKNYWYPMRLGESLVEMDDATTRRILNEAEPDFSSEIVPGLSLSDLDSNALEKFRTMWSTKAQRPEYLTIGFEQILNNLHLSSPDGLTVAALLLLGTEQAIAAHLPDAELIFEWRQEAGKTAFDARDSWRKALVLSIEDVWEVVNQRNLRFPLQDGLFQRDVFAFEEKSIREALLNAVTHRDYRQKGQSVFIQASPDLFRVQSPGGFPTGITTENILKTSSWRNRRLAESLEKIGLVERSGQGLDDIFLRTVADGKGLPTIVESLGRSVTLEIPAQVIDPAFIQYIEAIINEKQTYLSLEKILELERIRTFGKIDSIEFRDDFLGLGLIEKVGRGRGTKYILSHRYYASSGRKGEYTRLVGLSREQKKRLILNHLEKNGRGLTSELKEALPDLKAKDVGNLLQELRRAGEIEFVGTPRTGHWQLTSSN